MIDRWYFYNKK